MKIKINNVLKVKLANTLFGVGYDIHRLQIGNGITLCGIKIPFDKSFVAHSDGDVPIHAMMDAILSALGEKDIGNLFPADDNKFINADSTKLLLEVLDIAKSKGYKIGNVSISIIAEKPPINKYVEIFKTNLSNILNLANNKIGISATTNENVGDIGDGNAIAAFCGVTLIPLQS